MDDTVDLVSALLSQIAGILEDARALAASTRSVVDPAAAAQLQLILENATALLDAVQVLGRM